MKNYQAANPALWQGRKDSLPGERIFQTVQCVQPEKLENFQTENRVILGFASDTGVSRNLGRPGAALGPDALRTQLGKLPAPAKKQYLDLGNIHCQDEHLEDAQQQFAELISLCHQHGKKTLALGGGHEIAWAHFQGLAPHYGKLGIINFDAHFDLRPLPENQQGNSGTPFTQIAAYCAQEGRPFDYCCLGIQSKANTESLWQQAENHKVSVLKAEDLYQQSFAWQTAFLDEFLLSQQAIYLTLCLDVLAEAYAPGVSAPQPLGLTPWQVLTLMKYILRTGKVVSLDIAELSPPHDENGKTARLAANLVAELLDLL